MPSEHDLSKEKNQDAPSVIEYFDREGLNKFLYNHRKEVNGILQRFLDPKTTHNEVIRAIWSPKLCLLERAENIHQLHDQRYGLYEKCVVYEGPDYYYRSSPLRGPVLSGQIQKLCEAITSHINEVTYGQKQISRIVLTFKVDSRDKLWLLYSTSIRCLDMLEFQPLGSQIETAVTRNLLNIDRVIQIPEKVTLNPFKTYEKIVPKVLKSCISCTKETVEELRHPVTYKSVIKHYEHVLFLLKSSISLKHSNRKEGTIAWPPDPEIVNAAGGVGFCGITDNGATDDKPRKRTDHIRYKPLKDVQIPPIIASLHPKLTTDTYSRCKDDPLFLNKSVSVCESCYLVYAEFSMLLLELGENISKLLSPDPIMHSFVISEKSKRPTSADWRAIGGLNSQSITTGEFTLNNHGSLTSLSRSALLHHHEAKDRSIGLRNEDQRSYPDVPTAIRSKSESAANFRESTISDRKAQSPYIGGLLEGDSMSIQTNSQLYDTNEVQSMIADRERRFFKEISLNPQLKDSHPLQHLISTQQKLKLIDQQSGVLISKKNDTQSLFGTKYGRQTSDFSSKYAPYETEIPYTINGEIILPSILHQRKSEKLEKKRSRKQKTLKSFLSGEGSIQLNVTQGTPSTAVKAVDINVKNSVKYREFLADSLKKIEEISQGVKNRPPNQEFERRSDNLSAALLREDSEIGAQSLISDLDEQEESRQKTNYGGKEILQVEESDGFSVTESAASSAINRNTVLDTLEQSNPKNCDDLNSLQSGLGTVGYSVESMESHPQEGNFGPNHSSSSFYKDSLEQEDSLLKEKSEFLLTQFHQERR
jgi:hypothetical protein